MTDRDTLHPDDQTSDDSHRAPRCTALVPRSLPGGSERANAAEPAPRPFAIVHHDPSFVAQLIATAAHAPQTRLLRRASPEDAQSSYRSTANALRRRPPARPQATSRVA